MSRMTWAVWLVVALIMGTDLVFAETATPTETLSPVPPAPGIPSEDPTKSADTVSKASPEKPRDLARKKKRKKHRRRRHHRR